MLRLALNGGILSSIWDAIKAIVTFFTNFTDILKGIFQATIIYAYSIFYYLFMSICSIVNFAEMLFKKFAGIDPIMTDRGEMNILDVFVKSNEIWGLFVSIIILSIVLLFIFTIVAVIKSEFSLDAKGSAKGPIIARSLKSLAMFLIVPAVSLMGIYAVNAITDTINSMMKGSDETTMVNQVFYTMSYNANKARINKEFADFINGYSGRNGGKYANDNGGAFKGNQEQVAYQIDMAFKGNLKCEYKYKWISFPLEMIDAQDFSTLFMPVIGSRSTYSIWDITQVNLYYSVLDMDYIVGIGSALVITYMLLSMCVVLIKRIFEIVILLLLAAPMISLAPLDGGSASKSWQKEFTKRVISIVAPVFAINMYFIMVPLFQKITIFGGGVKDLAALGAINMSSLGSLAAATGAYATYDAFFQLVVICVGMSVVKTASALLCNLLGIEDLIKSGGEATKKAVGTAVQIAGMATGVGGAAAAVAKGGISAIANAKSAGKGNRLAGLKAGWASTQEDRTQAFGLLKDKTLKSDMVKGSAFGQLLDPDTYKNIGKTGKQIKEEQAKKEALAKKKADSAADAQMAEDSQQKTMKSEYQKDITSHYDGMIAKQQEILSNKNNTEDKRRDAQKLIGDYIMQRENALAASEKMKFKRNEFGTVVEKTPEEKKPEYVRPEVKDAYQVSETTAKVGRSIGKGAKAVGGAVGKVAKGVANSSVGQVVGVYVGGTVGKVKQDVGKFAGGVRNVAGKVAGGVGNVAGKVAGDVRNVAGKFAETKVGKVVIKAGSVVGGVASDVAGQTENAAKRVGQALGAGTQGALRESELAAGKKRKELLDQVSKTQAKSEDKSRIGGMSEEVEKGMKESAGDLARSIKEALQSGKLPVDGMAKLTAQVESLNKAIAAAKNNDDANAINDLIKGLKDALADALKK